MTYQEIFAQEKEKRQAALVLLGQEKPDMEAIKSLTAEADALHEKGGALKANTDALDALKEPAPLPAPLPTEPDKEPEAEPKDAAVKAVHVLRYGEQDSAVKAVLSDLYGPDYNAKRWEQRQAFRRYLRGGENALKSADRVLLSEVMLTPEYAIQAIKSGRDIQTIKTVMIEAQDDLGGYTVPVDLQSDIIKRLMGLVVMRGKARTRTTSRDQVLVTTMTGGDSTRTNAMRGTWVDETPTAGTAATNLTFGNEKIPVNTYMGEVFLSKNVLEDSAYNLEQALAEGFSETAAIDEDSAFLTGVGTNRPLGLLPGSANTLSLDEANSGNASALTWDGLIELIYTPDSQYRNRCIFIAEKATYKAIAKMKDGNGQYLWRDRFGNNVSEGGELTRLMGYDTFEQEALPTIAASAYPILFGDPTGYTVVDRVGMTISRYDDSATSRINQVCFVMRRRLGGKPTETWKWAVQKVSA